LRKGAAINSFAGADENDADLMAGAQRADGRKVMNKLQVLAGTKETSFALTEQPLRFQTAKQRH
jgi:hypothetical protein